MLFLHDGIRLLAGANDASGGNLMILPKTGSNVGKGFLQNYDSAPNYAEIHISDGKMFETGGVGGWEALNQRGGCGGVCYPGSAFSKETGTGDGSIRSAILAHDPSALNNEGKVMLDEAVRWMAHDSAYAYTVPSGTVALLTRDYNFDNKVQPGLTLNETQAESVFTGLGLPVARVPQKLKYKTDWSKAAFVAVADSPPSGYSINTYLNTRAPRMVFLNTGLKALTMGTGVTLKNSYEVLNTADRPESFMQAYAPTDHRGGAFPIQANPGAYTLPDYGTSGSWNVWGWKTAGGEVDSNPANYAVRPTAWYVKNAARCGAAFGYAPDRLNQAGTLLLKNVIRWVYHACYLPSKGAASSETVETVRPYYSAATGTQGAGQYSYSCGAGRGEDTKNIMIGSGINEYVYKVELESYNMDDTGVVEINGQTVVNKDVCSYGQNTPCSGGPTSVPGRECKGGCAWTGSGWGPYLTTPENGCVRPPKVNPQITLGMLHEGSNPVHVKANDCICGQNTAEATIKVYKKTAP